MNEKIETSTFAGRIVKLLERVDYRRVDTLEDKLAIYRMRHEAYVRDGSAERQPSGIFNDHYDELPNAWLIGVYIDGELAGSLRLHVGLGADASLPVRTAFPEIIEPRLRAGQCLIDGTRFVTNPDFAGSFPELPYLTLRASFVGEEFFNTDYMTAGCRDEHRAFYTRMFGCKPWAPARPYPHLTRLIGLVGYDCKAQREKTYTRHPYLVSDAAEQRRLFSVSSNGAPGSDYVKASEREAVEA